jgi:hypothetical protein
MSEGVMALSQGMLAQGKVTENVTGRQDKIEAAVKCLETAVKGISDALKIPARPASVQPGTAVPKDGDDKPDDLVPYAVLRKSLDKAFVAETNPEKRQMIGRFMTAAEAQRPITRKALEQAGIAIVANPVATA